MVSKTKAGKTRNVECPYCDATVYSRNALIMHIAHKHPEKPNLGAKKAPKLKPLKKAEPEPELEPEPGEKEASAEGAEEFDDEEAEEDDIYG